MGLYGTPGDMWDYHMGLWGICGTTTWDSGGYVELPHGTAGDIIGTSAWDFMGLLGTCRTTTWDSWGYVGLPHGTLGISGTSKYNGRGLVGLQHGTPGNMWDYHMGLWGSYVVVPHVPCSYMLNSHISPRVPCGSPTYPPESHVVVPHVPCSPTCPLPSYV